MPLPKIDLPIYSLTLPSNGKEIKYRPFLVKEEKILIFAQTSDEIESQILAISQVVNNCVLDYDTTNLPSFDIEYIFLKLRSISVSDTGKLLYNDPDSEEPIELNYNLSDIYVDKKDIESNIAITDTITIEMRYPTYNDYTNLSEGTDGSIEFVIKCIGTIYEGENAIDPKDYSLEEMSEFVQSIPTSTFKQINNFINNIPKVKLDIDYTVKVKNRNKKKKLTLQGLSDFF